MNIKKMENKVKVWLARGNSGELFLSSERPYKMENYWGSEVYTELDSSLFPSVKWEDDEPTEAYITLANEPQEQPTPKQEIDWEQRRYEIAKDLYLRYENMDEKGAVHSADVLIKELKAKR